MKSSTPNIAIFVIVIVLLSGAAAIYYGKQKIVLPDSDMESLEKSSSETPTLAANAEFSASNSADSNVEGGSVSATPAPSAAPLGDYIFANAKIIRRTSARIEMESTADASEITNWYKEKIKSSNFNAKSFTQTNTNGTILNKLSAAKPGEKLDITIKKDQNGSIVTITVDRS